MHSSTQPRCTSTDTIDSDDRGCFRIIPLFCRRDVIQIEVAPRWQATRSLSSHGGQQRATRAGRWVDRRGIRSAKLCPHDGRKKLKERPDPLPIHHLLS